MVNNKNSIRLILILNLFGFMSCSNNINGQERPDKESNVMNYVDTRIGSSFWLGPSTLAPPELPYGWVYPGVGVPFAMTQCTPQTTTGHYNAPYSGEDEKIQGFRLTHNPNGSPMSDYGAITFMPVVGKLKTGAEERASVFSHDNEIGKPYYYSVELDDYNVKAELTGVSKASMMQFTFPESKNAHIVIDNPFSYGYFHATPEKNEIEGYIDNSGRFGNQGFTGESFACYFVAEFNKPFETIGMMPIPNTENTLQMIPDGFKGEYFNNMNLSGKPVLTRNDTDLNFSWPSSPGAGINSDEFSVRWTGKLTATTSARHTFYLTSDDGARLYVDGELLIDSWHDRGAVTDKYELELKAGQTYDIKIEYYEHGGGASMTFRIAFPNSYTPKQLVHMLKNGTKSNVVYLSFKTSENEKVKVKIGTSFISMDQARRNLKTEIGHWDFNQTAQETKQEWNNVLHKMDIEGSEEDKKIFYTALQRCHVGPRNMTEDGYHYSGFNEKVMPGIMYTDFSIWDTFRSLHPLLVLTSPNKVTEMIQALLNSYDEGGWMPKWPSPGYSSIMVGTHADAVIADAYVKGIRGFDTEKAFEAMLKNANVPGNNGYVARGGVSYYNKLGYVPTDKVGESVIRTMEFAYDDYCIAQMAKALGKDDYYAEFMKRAQRYQNVLDPETKLVRGRNVDGTWRDPKDFAISGWTGHDEKQCNIYYHNITLFAPHDVQGLVNFMGDDKAFIEFLDNFFANDFYYVGDEWSMHAPYLYNYVGAPWKTQKIIRELLDINFTTDLGGLPGNEDSGQLSSWYVFGAMGLYPVSPGNLTYQIGSPVLDKIALNLPNGKTFTVIANNNSKENVYIQSATLNGKPYTKSWIHHDDIMSGSTLVFEMGPLPNKEWGSAFKYRPFSVSKPK